MDDDSLVQAFRKLNARIIREVNPESIIDELFAKNIIESDDYRNLSNDPDPRSRCRKFMSLLYCSSRPEAFIHLREALLDEYPEIVDEIDKQRTSLTGPQPQQQLHLSQSTDGKILLVLRPLLSPCRITLDTLTHQSSMLTESCCSQTNSIQVLLCGVNPILSRSFWLSLRTIRFL